MYRELSVNIDFKDVKTDDVNDSEHVDLTQMINQINSFIEDINKKYAISLNQHTIPNNDDVHSQNEHLLKEKGELLLSQQKTLDNTLDQGYLPVTKSWEISLTEKTKNIFKLHGDLRGPKKDIYGFDGDNHKHYVITQEDYEWTTDSMFPSKIDSKVEPIRLMLPIQVKDVINEYVFVFNVQWKYDHPEFLR